MPRYTAVLDACVLVPIALGDTLLRAAEKGLYRPLWSMRILAEAQAATEEIHHDLGTIIAALTAHGLTQSQIADMTGILQSRLSEYARRKRTPRAAATFEALANGLGMPPAARQALGLASLSPWLTSGDLRLLMRLGATREYTALGSGVGCAIAALLAFAAFTWEFDAEVYCFACMRTLKMPLGPPRRSSRSPRRVWRL
jgi:transcriptional regulator with XRE-family HTH domain